MELIHQVELARLDVFKQLLKLLSHKVINQQHSIADTNKWQKLLLLGLVVEQLRFLFRPFGVLELAAADRIPQANQGTVK